MEQIEHRNFVVAYFFLDNSVYVRNYNKPMSIEEILKSHRTHNVFKEALHTRPFSHQTTIVENLSKDRAKEAVPVVIAALEAVGYEIINGQKWQDKDWPSIDGR